MEAIVALGDGDVIIGGQRYGATWIARLDPDGDQLWTTSYPMAAGRYHDIVVSPSGELLALGEVSFADAPHQGALHAYADDGTMIWESVDAEWSTLALERGAWWKGGDRLLAVGFGGSTLLAFDHEGIGGDPLDINGLHPMGLTAFGEGFAACSRRTDAENVAHSMLVAYDATGVEAWRYVAEDGSADLDVCAVASHGAEIMMLSSDTSSVQVTLLRDGNVLWSWSADHRTPLQAAVAFDVDGDAFAGVSTYDSSWLRAFSSTGGSSLLAEDSRPYAEAFPTSLASSRGRIFHVGYEMMSGDVAGYVTCYDLDVG